MGSPDLPDFDEFLRDVYKPALEEQVRESNDILGGYFSTLPPLKRVSRRKKFRLACGSFLRRLAYYLDHRADPRENYDDYEGFY